MASTMKAWQYSTAPIDKTMTLNRTARPPPVTLKPDQVAVEVISSSINPVDFVLPEIPIIGKFVASKPASPGIDFSGRIVSAGSSAATSFKRGQLVFGRLDQPTQFGTLGQFIIAPSKGTVPLPLGVDLDHAAAAATAGLTAYQSIALNVQKGDKVFINGGSGGTGTFGIQIAKAMGCHVTTTCSGANAQLCKDLGADEIIDYRTSNPIEELRKNRKSFNLVVDNVGEPRSLYKASTSFLKNNGKFVQVGASPSWASAWAILSNMALPAILGGGKAKYTVLLVKPNQEDLTQLGQWMQEGKIRAVINENYEFEDARKAIERLKTGRVRGKIVVHVTDKH